MSACCENKDNRVTVEVKESKTPQCQSVMKIEVCSVCSRKHYTLYAEPLVLEMEANG